MKIKLVSLIIALLFICTVHTSFASGDVIGIIEIKNQKGILEEVIVYGSPYVGDNQQIKDNIKLILENNAEIINIKGYQGNIDFMEYIKEIYEGNLKGDKEEQGSEHDYEKDSSFDIGSGREEDYTPGTGQYVEEIEVGIYLNGRELNEKGYSENGRTMIPLRAVAEALEGQVLSNFNNPNLKLVTVVYYDQRLDFRIGDQSAYLNHRQFAMDTAPVIKNGTTYIPFRYLLDIFKGHEVKLDSNGYKILIISKGE